MRLSVSRTVGHDAPRADCAPAPGPARATTAGSRRTDACPRRPADDDPDGIQAVLAAQNAPEIALATATLTNEERLILRLHAAGAGLVPGMSASSDIRDRVAIVLAEA